jgi:hypothetical protein
MTIVEVGELICMAFITSWTRAGMILHHLETKTQMSLTNRPTMGMDFVMSERPRIASARQVSDSRGVPAAGWGLQISTRWMMAADIRPCELMKNDLSRP